MLTLYILRHAKAHQNQPGVKDLDSPLQAAGHVEANKIGEYMQRASLSPQVIIGSSARRVHETLDLILPYFDDNITINLESALYLASSKQLTARLNNLERPTLRVLLIGHNPGITDLARMMAGNGDSDELQRLNANFPTAALAELRFDQDEWSAVGRATGRLIRLIIPVNADITN